MEEPENKVVEPFEQVLVDSLPINRLGSSMETSAGAEAEGDGVVYAVGGQVPADCSSIGLTTTAAATVTTLSPMPATHGQAVTGQQKIARLPNVTLPCKDGVVVEVKSFVPESVLLDTVKLDYVFGRSENEGGKFRVFPTEPGEQEIGLVYRHEEKRCTTVLKLLVNQDPKKLWVRNDPPSGSPFMKKLYDSQTFEGGGARFVAASRRGRSHEQAGTFRDDDFGFWGSPNADVFLIVVADGAGSAKYSREGSRRVVRAVIDYLSPRVTADVWEAPGVLENKNGKMAQMLVSAANNALVQLNAFCKEENQKPNATETYALRDFNTTLLMAAVKVLPDGARQIVTFSIGDGAIAWVEPGKSELLCSPDGGEYSGQTRFLTTTPVWAKAAEDWSAFRNERVFTRMISSDSAKCGFLALMTDGVSDPFFETDVKLHDAATWDAFVQNAADVDEGEKVLGNILANEDGNAGENLLSWLGFWSRGNHDDRTLAALLPIGHWSARAIRENNRLMAGASCAERTKDVPVE